MLITYISLDVKTRFTEGQNVTMSENVKLYKSEKFIDFP